MAEPRIFYRDSRILPPIYGVLHDSEPPQSWGEIERTFPNRRTYARLADDDPRSLMELIAASDAVLGALVKPAQTLLAPAEPETRVAHRGSAGLSLRTDPAAGLAYLGIGYSHDEYRHIRNEPKAELDLAAVRWLIGELRNTERDLVEAARISAASRPSGEAGPR